MPRNPSNRFALVDLVMVVMMCGLIAAFARTPAVEGKMAVLIVAVVVVMAWVILRAKFTGATCEECGRRFSPQRNPKPTGECPHCGRSQVALLRSSKRLRRLFWIPVILIPVSLIAALAASPAASSPAAHGTQFAIFLVATAGIFASIVAILALGAYRYARERPRDRACESCGGVIPARPGASLICPLCQLKKLEPGEAKKMQTKGLGSCLLALVVLGGVLLAAVRPRLAGWLSEDGPALLVLALISIAVVVTFLAMRVFLRILAVYRLLGEPAAIARARRRAGVPGEIVPDGPSTIWYSGPTDPTPMLREQREAARARFESLLGATAIDPPTPRILCCFHDRGAFEKFHTGIGLGKALARLDGHYFPRPWGMISLCTGEAPVRVVDPEITARSLFGFVLIEAAFGAFPPPWLQPGLSRALTRSDRADLIHLNRRMQAAIARGTTWSEELFKPAPRRFAKFLRRPDDLRAFEKFEQFAEQSASVVEYLCGDRAPGERKVAFRDFLTDRTSVGRPEEAFFQRFGFGFGSLLESWHEWVIEQGIGTHESPPAPIRDALLHRLLPIIADGQAGRSDRIMALREWARLGFVLGADILIGQLREGGDIPKEEIAWALSMVSGMALGNETDRWQAWWEGLPIAVREPQPDGV